MMQMARQDATRSQQTNTLPPVDDTFTKSSTGRDHRLPSTDHPQRTRMDVALGGDLPPEVTFSEVPLSPGDLRGLLKLASKLAAGKDALRRFSNPLRRGNFGEFPKAGDEVSGFSVGGEIPNTSSISSSLDDYAVQPGVREIPLTHLTDLDQRGFVAANSLRRSEQLAEAIKQSKRIDPLIVVDDAQGFPTVLEGAHRLEALRLLRNQGEEVGNIPALLVREFQ